jgi:HlyD family secretion protein
MSSEHYTPFGPGRDVLPDGSPAPLADPPVVSQSDISVSRTPTFSFGDDADEGGDLDRPSRPWQSWRVWLAVVVVVALVGGIVIWRTRPTATPLQFTTDTVTQGNLAVTVSATGPLSAGVYNLNFSTSATVTEIDVKVGQSVKAGQVLAKIDPTSLQNALNSAQAQLNSAQINYNNALSALSDAQKAQTASDAVAQDAYNAVVSPGPGKPTPTPQQAQQAQDQLNQALAQAQNAVNQAQSQVQSAQAQVQSAQVQVQTAQDNLSQATLTAPADGTVTQINGSVGALSGAGTSGSGSSSGSSGSGSSTPFIQIVNLSAFQIVAQVNEADIGTVNTGQAVQFTVQAFPSDTFYGTVVGISPVGQTSSNVVTYPVTIAVDAQSASQARLFPGMTASVTITTQQAVGATLVPNTALSYARTAVTNGRISASAARAAILAAQQMITSAPNGSLNAGTSSFVLEEQNGKLVAVPVVTGIANSTYTVVLAGLNVGDVVVTGDNQTTSTTTTSSSTPRGRNGLGGGLGGGLP